MMNKVMADEIIRRQVIYQDPPDKVYELGVSIQNEELGRVFIPRAQLCLLGDEAKTTVLGRIINYVPYMFDEEEGYFVGSCSLAVGKNVEILPGCSFESVQVGDQLTGVVEAIGMFEVRVNLGGAVGLIRKADLLFEELTAAGDVIHVRVVHKDEEKQSLMLTQFLFRPSVGQDMPGIVWNPGGHGGLSQSPLAPNEALADPLDELNSLIGLESIKQDVRSLINLVRMQRIREQKGLKSIPVSLHLVFTGNPGTGKTSVARILAQLYRAIGVLKVGQLVEVDRAGLVAGYLGQTALKTQEKINQAMGGVLFIDEAYTLAKDGNDFGQEAIDTLLKAMEDRRGEFVVIVAGYDKPMETFINSNPGLKSRFNKFFKFPDYSAAELIQIFDALCEKFDYRITEEAHALAAARIERMERCKGEHFANAREIRNYFETVVTRQANRIAMCQSITDDEVFTLTAEDL